MGLFDNITPAEAAELQSLIEQRDKILKRIQDLEEVIAKRSAPRAAHPKIDLTTRAIEILRKAETSGLPLKEFAKLLNVSGDTAYQWLYRTGIRKYGVQSRGLPMKRSYFLCGGNPGQEAGKLEAEIKT